MRIVSAEFLKFFSRARGRFLGAIDKLDFTPPPPVGHPRKDGYRSTVTRRSREGKGFAIFPNADAGYAAAVERMGQIAEYPSRSGQPAGSLANIVYIWSPPSENDTEGMISDITKWSGLSRNVQYSSLSPDQKLSFVRAYAKREGYSSD